MRRLSPLSVALLVFPALGACGDDDTRTPVDAGRDAVVLDAGAGEEDAGSDAGEDRDTGPVADTWDTFANDFVQTYCVECHSRSPRNFHELEEVRANGATARCGVTAEPLDDCTGFPPPRQFPVGDGPFPSDDERTRFVEWIEAGAP